MEKRYQAGQISRLQLLQAESRYKSVVPETIRARRNRDLSANSLKIMAGIPLSQLIRLQGDFESMPPMPTECILNEILPKRLDMEALQWQERLQETGIRAQKADRLPKLDLNLIYNFASMSDEIKLERANTAYIVGLKFQFPIYSGGYISAQIKKTQIEQQRTRLKMDSLQKQIDKDLRDVRLRLLGARDSLEAARQNLLTAREAFQITEITVKNGLSTQLELKDARLLFDQAEMGVYQASFEYLSAYYDWQEIIGGNTPSGG